jgi:hypothetical protein
MIASVRAGAAPSGYRLREGFFHDPGDCFVAPNVLAMTVHFFFSSLIFSAFMTKAVP